MLLLLTGGTGLHSVNNQIQADKFAGEGFLVVMPDLFDGDAAPSSSTIIPDETEAEGSMLDVFKIKAAETAKSFMIDMWLARHTEEKVLPILHKVIDASKDEFADAVSNGGGIYSVGYCFGGRYVLLLAAERSARQQQGFQTLWSGGHQNPVDEEGARPKTDGPHIKAGAVAHATLVSKDDFIGLKAPVSFVCVESDPMFPDDVRTAGEDYMSKNNVEHEVQVYPGVPHGRPNFPPRPPGASWLPTTLLYDYLPTHHLISCSIGFAVFGEYDDENIKGAQITAFEQMLNWVKEH